MIESSTAAGARRGLDRDPQFGAELRRDLVHSVSTDHLAPRRVHPTEDPRASLLDG